MRLTPVITQIRAYAPMFVNRVYGASDYQRAKESTSVAAPSAFVLPLSADVDQMPGGNRAEFKEGFAVEVCLDNSADERGQASADAVEDARIELLKALMFWQPGERYEPIEFEGGNLTDISRAQLWYRFEFSTVSHLTRADGFNPDLPRFEGVNVRVDEIDPAADSNISRPGPDGRIEHEMHIDLPAA